MYSFLSLPIKKLYKQSLSRYISLKWSQSNKQQVMEKLAQRTVEFQEKVCTCVCVYLYDMYSVSRVESVYVSVSTCNISAYVENKTRSRQGYIYAWHCHCNNLQTSKEGERNYATMHR